MAEAAGRAGGSKRAVGSTDQSLGEGGQSWLRSTMPERQIRSDLVCTGALAPTCATSASANITARRPIDNAGVATCATPGSPFGTLFLAQSNQTASYNGLQTTIQLRMTRGVMLYGFYTFSHTFDSVSARQHHHTRRRGRYDQSAAGAGTCGFRYPPSICDCSRVAIELLQRESSLKRAFLNGWAVSPIIKIHSGLPFTVLNGKDANLSGNSSAERAQLVPGVDPVLGNRNVQEWFNTAAFSQNQIVTGTAVNGNSSRNMLRGPTFNDVDLSISRDFSLSHFREGCTSSCGQTPTMFSTS